MDDILKMLTYLFLSMLSYVSFNFHIFHSFSLLVDSRKLFTNKFIILHATSRLISIRIFWFSLPHSLPVNLPFTIHATHIRRLGNKSENFSLVCSRWLFAVSSRKRKKTFVHNFLQCEMNCVLVLNSIIITKSKLERSSSWNLFPCWKVEESFSK